MKRFIARRRRIVRIQREIPAEEKPGRGRSRNLRDLILNRAADKAWRCDCIRCREVAPGEPSARDKEDAFGHREERPASGRLELIGSYEHERGGA
jgi:elongator complex protein 3